MQQTCQAKASEQVKGQHEGVGKPLQQVHGARQILPKLACLAACTDKLVVTHMPLIAFIGS